MNNPAIKIENLNVIYPIYGDSEFSLRSKFANFFNRNKKVNDIKYIHALKNINLEINEGERVGLIGPNGSGKTTFLKTVSGIYKPSTGYVKSNYDIYTMLDVGMGLSGDATGRENIDLMALVRGLSRAEIEPKKEDIINFSGIRKSIDLPLRTYSSGMGVRLATAIALEIDFEIIVIDEFFGAGDEEFRLKTDKRLREMMKTSKVVLFASHDFGLVENICNRVLKFDNGEIIEDRYI